MSAHASTEELFVLKDVVTGLLGGDGMGAVTVAWKTSQKAQPAGAKFVVPSTDAPNVNGARDVGFAVGQGNGHDADTSCPSNRDRRQDASKRCMWWIRGRMALSAMSHG